MHTFFINTSSKKLNKYDTLFDIHRENKSLVILDTPMKYWFNECDGYVDCVKKMGDMIDSYVELNNSFNLILYIDLSEVKAYTDMERDEFEEKDRDACLKALHLLFTHVVKKSIIDGLDFDGRIPGEILIIFGEDKKLNDMKVNKYDDHVMEKVFFFLGMPDIQTVRGTLEEISAAHTDKKERVAEFKKRILEKCGTGLVPDILKKYDDKISLWCEEVVCNDDIDNANRAFFDRLNDVYKTESSRRIGIERASFSRDIYAQTENKSVLAISQLNLAFYLIRCVEDRSIYETVNDNGNIIKRVKDFHYYSAEELASFFKIKIDAFTKKLKEIDPIKVPYYHSTIKLAPEVKDFDHERFGMDRDGYSDEEVEIVDEEPSKKSDLKDGEEQMDAPIIPTNKKLVRGVLKKKQAMLDEKEYDYFGEHKEDQSSDNIINQGTQEFITAQRKTHTGFLKALKNHVVKVASRYAGRSPENDPPIMEKRRVNVAETVCDGYGNCPAEEKCRYAASNNEKETKNSRTLGEMRNVSQNAYKTARNEYLDFCAGDSVTVTDIDDLLGWCAASIEQVEKSLKNMAVIFCGLLVAVLVLYIPFWVIQSEAIFENIATLTVALGSLAVPVALLIAVYSIMLAKQLRKKRKIKEKTIKKSQEILKGNNKAVNDFDTLLGTYIPRLRWTYEYKLDVEFYDECCRMAPAKLEHHKQKLKARINMINNIIEDIECDPGRCEDLRGKIATEEVSLDYNLPFCEGPNGKLYSVIDEKLLGAIKDIKK